MFAKTKLAAVAFSLVGGVAQAQFTEFPQPVNYTQPVDYTQPVAVPQPAPQAGAPQYQPLPTQQYPVQFPAPVAQPAAFPQPVAYTPAPAVIPEPPVKLGFQWAMCDYGMYVSALRAGGIAQQIGLLPGDIIVQMNAFQITGWDQYCLAMYDAVTHRGGQMEMWLYRASSEGYQLQYVSFTVHEEQVVVVVPCCYHVEKCHAPQVTCWVSRLSHLNNCWKQHGHHGHGHHDHHGVGIQFLGQGLGLKLGGSNFGKMLEQHNNGGFGKFKTQDIKSQLKNLNNLNPNFKKQFENKFNNKSSNGFSNQLKNLQRFSNGGNHSSKNFSSRNISSQISRGMSGGFKFGGGKR